MRILHVLSQTEMTGAEAYAKILIEGQRNEGHETFLISEKLHVSLPIEWISMPLASGSRWQRLSSIRKLNRFLKDKGIDIIHCHSRAAVRHMAWARIGTRAALVTTLHGRQHYSFSKRLWNLYGELQIAVCENVKLSFAKDFRIHPDQIQVIGNPIASFQNQNPPQHLLPKRPLSIGFIGRSSGPKGERFEAIGRRFFKTWLTDYPSLKIDLLTPHQEGFSPAFRSLTQKLSEQFPDRFRTLHEIKNLSTKLNEYDLVVGSGRVALESLAAQTQVYALGEFCDHGFVTESNFEECRSTNFGDMGVSENPPPWNLDLVGDRMNSFLENIDRPPSETDQRSATQKLSQRVQKFYSMDTIHREITQVYCRAIFKRKHPRSIPHLMYHKIPHQELTSRHRIFVTRENFKNHLNFFRQHQFETILLSELRDYIFKSCSTNFNGRPFPPKPLLLTFDDGYLDNLENAQALLKEFGFRAHIFLLADAQINSNIWDAQDGNPSSIIMNKEQRKQLDLRVWEIGSHGFSHPRLTDINERELLHEIRDSKQSLSEEFNTEILAFAYPFGIRNTKVESVAREFYDFAVNTDQGGLHLADNLHSLFRVNIFPEDGPRQLKKKCSPFYRRYFFYKRGR